MQYIALLWTEKKGKLLQVFGPYPNEKSAQDAADRVADWPAIKDGQWEVVPLYPNPKQPVQQTVTQSWTGGTLSVTGAMAQLFPTSWTVVTDRYLPYPQQNPVTVTVPVGSASVTLNGALY